MWTDELMLSATKTSPSARLHIATGSSEAKPCAIFDQNDDDKWIIELRGNVDDEGSGSPFVTSAVQGDDVVVGPQGTDQTQGWRYKGLFMIKVPEALITSQEGYVAVYERDTCT